MSWLGKLNTYVLQWFCIRLAKLIEEDGTISGWNIIYPISPISGWSTDYKLLWGKKIKHIILWRRK